MGGIIRKAAMVIPNKFNSTVEWLLETYSPSVRFWTLTEILGKPMNEADVRSARNEIGNQVLVREVFSRQHPDGHWGDDPRKPYTAEGCIGVLSLLYTLGVTPDERTAAGCEALLKYGQNECGGLSLVRNTRSGIFPCTTGEHLPMLVYFGMGDDPRVRKAFQFVIDDMVRDDALDCGRYQHRDCLWGAIAALNGLAVLPADMRSDCSRQVVESLAGTLLDAPYDFEGEHKRWLTFGVPRVWDLLSALKALANHGFGHDPRFQILLERILALRDSEGRLICGSVSRTWPLEKRGKTSKWVTLDMLRVMKMIS